MDYSKFVIGKKENDSNEVLIVSDMPRDNVKSLLGFERSKAILNVGLEGVREKDGLHSMFEFINPYGMFKTEVFCIDEYMKKMCQDAELVIALYNGIQIALQNRVQYLKVFYKDFATLERLLNNCEISNQVERDLQNYLMWVSQYIIFEFSEED